MAKLAGILTATGCLLFTVKEISKPPIATTSRTWKVDDVAKAMVVEAASDELVLTAAVKTLDASAVPKAPANCCSVLTMAAPSALYFAGNWLSSVGLGRHGKHGGPKHEDCVKHNDGRQTGAGESKDPDDCCGHQQ